MTALTVSSFVKPYPQEALCGELGLTSLDVAAALGARHSHVKDHVKRLKSIDPTFAAETAKLPGTKGRPLEVQVFALDESKVLVASYQNALGLGYLRFLVECERIATELTPRLIAELNSIKTEVAALQSKLDTKKARALKPAKTVMETKEFLTGDSMFGDGLIVKRKMTRVPASSLSPIQILEAKRVMLILQNEGTARRIKDISNEIDFVKQQALLPSSDLQKEMN